MKVAATPIVGSFDLLSLQHIFNHSSDDLFDPFVAILEQYEIKWLLVALSESLAITCMNEDLNQASLTA